MRIQKIISGGQTGADLGALQAAYALGLNTGGNAPKNYRTEDGPRPSLGRLYGLKEGHSTDYKWRTFANVGCAEATLIVATKPDSAGTRQTIGYCKLLGRPYLVVRPDELPDAWLWVRAFEVLNVAGNRESVSPGITEATKMNLIKACTTARAYVV